MANLNEPSQNEPDQQFIDVLRAITGVHNITADELTKPILRPTIQNTYILYIIQYALLSVIGAVSNCWCIYYISKHKLYRDTTHAFFMNLSICHFVQSAFVVPVTLVTTIVHNWVLGTFMCYFVPMLQDIPLHAALLTHMLIAWDRMRWLADPMNTRFPAFVCSCATWLTGMVIALPYPIYTTYLDLGIYHTQFSGVGMCVVNLIDDSQEYTRGLFFMMYVAPSVILGYLYFHTARDLRPPEGELSVMMYEQRADIIAHRHQRTSTSSTLRSPPTRTSYNRRSYDLYDAQTDASREHRTQCMLGTMAACEIICIGPLMVLRFARQQIFETYENSEHLDLSYLMFIWMAFLPCVICPCIYSCWVIPRSTKDRIWRYFRLASRRSDDNKFETQNSAEDSITQVNTTETMVIETNTMHTPKSSMKQHQHSLGRSASKANTLTSLHATATALREKQLADKKQHQRKNERRAEATSKTGQSINASKNKTESLHLPDELSNSCSNITASTYLNGNEMSSPSIGFGLDRDGGMGTGNIDRKHSGLSANNAIIASINVDRDSIYSGISNDRMSHRSHDMMSESGRHLLSLRRESSSTYECDMDIIDLLERERSEVDMNDLIENEQRQQRKSNSDKSDQRKLHARRTMSHINRLSAGSDSGGVSGKGIGGRKLPDITKMTTHARKSTEAITPSSPKQRLISTPASSGAGNIDHHQSTNFPNFVFTHQYNEFAEARINRNRDVNGAVNANSSATALIGRSRNNSQSSFNSSIKRNNDAHAWNDEVNLNASVNRVTRTRSIDSRKSSTKSNHGNIRSGGGGDGGVTGAGELGGTSTNSAVLSNNYSSSTYANNL